MKNINAYLLIGLSLLFVFITMMAFPTVYTSKSPYEITGVESRRLDNGDYVFQTPPFEPGEKFLFGSDDSGRDIYSFVIYGAKLTLSIGLTVAFLRFLIGLIMGISAAFNNQLSGLVVNQFNSIFNAIPPLIICIIVLSIGFLKTLPKLHSVLVFILIMTLVEWSRIAVLVRERAEVILNKDFIKSELMIGKSRLGIVIENLLPHMFSELVVLFFMEISRVLTLMMQLGIFGIFIGNLQIVMDTSAGGILGKATSYEPEWASMLGSSKNYIRVAPWIVLSCSLAFFMSVLGFNFIGEGLRMMYQEGKQLFKNKKQQLIVLSLVAILFIAGLMTSHESIATSVYSQSTWPSLQEVSLIGMPQNKKLASAIESRLIALEVDPVDTTYQKAYRADDYFWINDVEVILSSEDISYRIDQIGLRSFGEYDVKGQVLDLRQADIIGSDFSDQVFQESCKDKFLVLDSELLDEKGILFFSERLFDQTDAIGVLIAEETPRQKEVGLNHLDGPLITMSEETLNKTIGQTLSVKIKAKKEEGQGSNVVGQVLSPLSTDKTSGVILGFEYNYLDKAKGIEQLNFAMSVIESIKNNQANLKKNVTFVFWDGSYDGALSGKNSYYTEYYYPIKYSMLYIDMTQVFKGEGAQSQLLYSDAYVTMSRPDTYSMAEFLVGELEDNVDNEPALLEPYSVFYHKRGIPSMYIGRDASQSDASQLKLIREAIVKTLCRDVY